MSEYESGQSEYEEDFEEPHSPVEEAPVTYQPSPPRQVSPPRQQRTPSQYTQNASVTSLGTAKSRKPANNERELRRLQKENQDLRSELKELNERLSVLLEQHQTQKRPISTGSRKAQARREQAKTSEKQLGIYQKEHAKLKKRLEKLSDLNYLNSLRKDIEEKQAVLKTHEKRCMQMQTKQQKQGKNLVKLYYQDELPDTVKANQELINESNNVRTALATLEGKLEKQEQTLETLTEKEYDLSDQYDRLREIAQHYNINPDKKPSVKKLKKFKMLNKQLDTIVKQSEATMSHMKTIEYSSRSNLEKLQSDLNYMSQELRKKEVVLDRVSHELSDIMAVAKSKNLTGLISHLEAPLKSPAANSMTRNSSLQSKVRLNSREIRERARLELQQQDMKPPAVRSRRSNRSSLNKSQSKIPIPDATPQYQEPTEVAAPIKTEPPKPEPEVRNKNPPRNKFNFKAVLSEEPPAEPPKEPSFLSTELNKAPQPEEVKNVEPKKEEQRSALEELLGINHPAGSKPADPPRTHEAPPAEPIQASFVENTKPSDPLSFLDSKPVTENKPVSENKPNGLDSLFEGPAKGGRRRDHLFQSKEPEPKPPSPPKDDIASMLGLGGGGSRQRPTVGQASNHNDFLADLLSGPKEPQGSVQALLQQGEEPKRAGVAGGRRGGNRGPQLELEEEDLVL